MLTGFLPGCGGDDYSVEPDQADSVLPAALNKRVDGALERIHAWCNGDISNQSLAASGYDTLVSVAEERPHAIHNTEGGDPATMVQRLEGIASTYEDSCGYARSLGDEAERLREK